MAVTTFIGQNIGASRFDRARQGLRTTYIMMLICIAVEIIPIMIFAPALVSMFNSDPDVVYYGTYFVRLISPFFPACCTANLIAAALRGAGDATSTMYILLGSYVVFRQIYLFTVSHLTGALTPVALGYPAGWVVAMIAILIYYRHHGLTRKLRAAAESQEES